MIWIGGVVVAGAILWLAGTMTPEEHVASVSAEYGAPPETVYAVIADQPKYPEWRSGVKKVEVRGDRVTEQGSFGPLSYRVAEKIPGRRLVTADAGGRERGFTGSWAFEIEPAGAGARLTITERGRVFNPIFRLMARFVFGYDRTLKQFHADLERRLAE